MLCFIPDSSVPYFFGGDYRYGFLSDHTLHRYNCTEVVQGWHVHKG